MKTIIIAGLLAVSTGAQAWYGEPSRYGNQFGNDSNSVKLYSPGGAYMGNLNDNQFDPNSVSNQFGRYGSRFSPDSINNPYRPLIQPPQPLTW